MLITHRGFIKLHSDFFILHILYIAAIVDLILQCYIENKSSIEGIIEMKKQIYMNRELSWLKFNSRVLEEAERCDVPLCERLSFVSIYQSNLDEFFMVRIGSLIDQSIVDSKSRDNKTDMTASEQISAAVSEVRVQSERYSAVYRSLMSKLAEQNVHIVDFKNISEEESKRLEHYYDTEIAPLISPVIVGKRQPFPFLRNKHIYAVASLLSRSGKQKLGIISCKSEVFPRLIEIKSQENTAD